MEYLTNEDHSYLRQIVENQILKLKYTCLLKPRDQFHGLMFHCMKSIFDFILCPLMNGMMDQYTKKLIIMVT